MSDFEYFEELNSEYVTRKAAAKILKVSERTVINIQNEGLLQPCKHSEDSKTIYYRKEQVDEVKMTRLGQTSTDPDDLLNDAAMNMAMAPSAIIRAISESMRIAQRQVVDLMAPVTAAMNMNMETLMKENESMRNRTEKLEGEIFEFIDLQKKAMREDAEARIMEIEHLEAQKMKREAFNRFMGYAPLLATLVGDKLGKNEHSRNQIRNSALVDIVDKMSIEQIEALQASGVFGQAELAVIISMKQRLEEERAARLAKESEAAEDEDEILGNSGDED